MKQTKNSKIKKVIAILLICLMMPIGNVISFATPDFPDILDPMHTYETSSGSTYTLNDFDLYYEDYIDAEITSKQDFIDYTYAIGVARQNSTIVDQIYNQFSKINDAEKRVLNEYLDVHPAAIVFVAFAKETAETYSYLYYGEEAGLDGTRGNAYKHAFATMYLCKYVSPDFAIDFVTAHEEVEDNLAMEKEMDLYNNQAAYAYYLTNPVEGSLLDTVLARTVFERAEQGEYIYIIENHPYLQSITYRPNSEIGLEIYATGRFFAYTNSTEPFNVPEPKIIYLPDLPTDPWDQIVRPNNFNNEGEEE